MFIKKTAVGGIWRGGLEPLSLARLIFISFACLLPMLAISCAPAGSAGYLQRTSSAANDHIMWVRENPPTFGFSRLQALAENYPDLDIFMKSKGVPTFLAETKKGQNRYLILYYPETRQAFACRSEAQSSHQIEFSGPYPITDNELETLGELQKGTNSAALR